MRDYKVGYGKPPAEHRFQKGQSGNRKGRSKDSRNFKTDLQVLFDEKLPLMAGGREIKISARQAMLLSLRNKALKGDIRAINMLVTLLERYLPETLTEDVKAAVGKDDTAIIAAAFRRRLEAMGTKHASDTETKASEGQP